LLLRSFRLFELKTTVRLARKVAHDGIKKQYSSTNDSILSCYQLIATC